VDWPSSAEKACTIFIQGRTAELKEPVPISLPNGVQSTVLELKLAMANLGLPATAQPQLFKAGNDATLAESGVVRGATVHIRVGLAGGGGDAVEETTDEMTDEMIEIFERAAEPTEDSLQSLGFMQTCEQTTNPMRASMVQRVERLFARTSVDRPMAETLLSPAREYPEFGGAWGRLTPPPPFPPCHFHRGPHRWAHIEYIF
jgi:hypothetical protein